MGRERREYQQGPFSTRLLTFLPFLNSVANSIRWHGDSPSLAKLRRPRGISCIARGLPQPSHRVETRWWMKRHRPLTSLSDVLLGSFLRLIQLIEQCEETIDALRDTFDHQIARRLDRIADQIQPLNSRLRLSVLALSDAIHGPLTTIRSHS